MGTFIHTADTHLGYLQYHRPEREVDYFDAFRQVIDGAIETEADGVVHAGDFFHDSRPSTTTLRTALEQLQRLAEHDIPFLGIVGNHEGTQTDQWIDIFSEFGLATHLSTQPTVVADTAFYGLDFIPESRRSHTSYSFEPTNAEYAVLVTHGLFEPVSPIGSWDITELLRTSQIPFDAVLLGDDHDPRLQLVDNTIVTYPGSTERTATDQRAARSYNRISTSNEIAEWIKQIPLQTRPHVFLEIELSPGEGKERILSELDNTEIRDAIVAIVLMGDGDDITPASIEEYARASGAFVVRVSDRRDFDPEGLSIDVHFADPDEAIREQIRQMDLSVAAYDLEQKVRETTSIAISNLTDVVEREFNERIEGSLEEFTTTADIGPTDDRKNDESASSAEISDPDSVTENQPQQASVAAEKTTVEKETVSGGTSQLRFDDIDT